MEQYIEKIESRGSKILPALGDIIDLYMFHERSQWQGTQYQP
jgi:hypothetical protein